MKELNVKFKVPALYIVLLVGSILIAAYSIIMLCVGTNTALSYILLAIALIFSIATLIMNIMVIHNNKTATCTINAEEIKGHSGKTDFCYKTASFKEIKITKNMGTKVLNLIREDGLMLPIEGIQNFDEVYAYLNALIKK